MAKKVKNKIDDNIQTLLNDVSEHTKFFCINGGIYKNLEELKNGLKKMDSKSFKFHVDKQHNHFANWVYDCIGDISLAEKIRDTTNQKDITKKITSRIASIKRKLKTS